MEPLAALLELSSAYHACPDADSLLRTFTTRLAARLNAQAVLVWTRLKGQDALSCRSSWSEAGARFQAASGAITDGFLVGLLSAERTRRLSASEATPSFFVHLAEDDRERVRSALHAPLQGAGDVHGVVEVLNKRGGEFTAEDAAFLEEASRLTGHAFETLAGIEEARHGDLSTIERLTALYDISRIFNSTLELDELLPVVAQKMGDLLGAKAAHVWLVDANTVDLFLAQQAGEDPTVKLGERAPSTEGLLGSVVKNAEARLVAEAAEEPLLAGRRARAGEEFELQSLMLAPLLKGDEVLGVMEVVNKRAGGRFDEDELFFFSSLSEQAAIALKNAERLVAERKVHELGALLAISKEITSTLNLDRVLLTVVNQAGTVLPFRRCSLGLFDRGKFILSAVSGYEAVPKSTEMEALQVLMAWVAEQNQVVHADQRQDTWEVEPLAGRDRLVSYLESAGQRGFYAMPLTDEQGIVGVITLENAEEDFLQENHLEVLAILASQATVAIRNALLYQQVPLISLMQPLLERKAQLLALPRARFRRLLLYAGATAALLIIPPWPMRIGANAQVVPVQRLVVASEVEGVIEKVFVREGSEVKGGEVLAELGSSDERVRLERAQAELAVSRRNWSENESRGRRAAANQARLEMEAHQAEVELYRERVEKARLRAPAAGVVVTPKVEEKVGSLLHEGDTFCELVDAQRLAIEINVPETDIDLLQEGAPVSLKLNAYPTHTYS
ncbi:MAG: GAF domain-containing protein, partial [Candidatus Acidiferrales bacterium]